MSKAFKGMKKPKCFSPNKVRLATVQQARAAAKQTGYRYYVCGDHYHLTSHETYWGRS